VVGAEFVEIDIDLARRAIDDNAWGYGQLVQLTDTAEPTALAQLAPHCLNIRDATTGNTLLHHCASIRNALLAGACLAPKGAVFVPIANNEGKTALHMALELRDQSMIQILAMSLTPDLNDTTGALLTDALSTAAFTKPEAVLPILNTIEAVVVVDQVAVHTLYHRAEVIGLATAALTPIDSNFKNSETFEFEQTDSRGLRSTFDLDLAPWNHFFPSADKHATNTLVYFKTVMLPGLGGDPGSMRNGTAFHNIVANCDVSVFESKLLQYVVQYKFETNVLPTLRRTMLLYTGAILLASAATLASARQLENGSAPNWVYIDVAQV
jgi:hypothetical protein